MKRRILLLVICGLLFASMAVGIDVAEKVEFPDGAATAADPIVDNGFWLKDLGGGSYELWKTDGIGSSAMGGAGVTDHGALTGLVPGAPDHTDLLDASGHTTAHDDPALNNGSAITGDVNANPDIGSHVADDEVHYVRPAQTLTVAKDGTGQFATIAAAVAVANANASSSSPYVIAIHPGEYDETVALDDWVSLWSVVPRQAKIQSISASPLVQINGTSYIYGLRLVAPQGDAIKFLGGGSAFLDNVLLESTGTGHCINFNGASKTTTLFNNSLLISTGVSIVAGKSASGSLKATNSTFDFASVTGITSIIDLDVGLLDSFANCSFLADDITGGATARIIDFGGTRLDISDCLFETIATSTEVSAIYASAGTVNVRGSRIRWLSTTGTPYDFNAGVGALINHAATVYDPAKTTGAGTIQALSLGDALFASIDVTGLGLLGSLEVLGASLLDSLEVTGAAVFAAVSIVGDLDIEGALEVISETLVPGTFIFLDDSTDATAAALKVKHESTEDADGPLGVSVEWTVEDVDSGEQVYADAGAERDGLDNVAKFVLRVLLGAGIQRAMTIGDAGVGTVEFPLADNTEADFGPVRFGSTSGALEISKNGDGAVLDGSGGDPILIGETIVFKVGDDGGSERISLLNFSSVTKAFWVSTGEWFAEAYGFASDTNTRLTNPVADTARIQAGNIPMQDWVEDPTQDIVSVNPTDLDIDWEVNWTGGQAISSDAETGIISISQGLPATEVSIADAGAFYVGTDVETALQEVYPHFSSNSLTDSGVEQIGLPGQGNLGTILGVPVSSTVFRTPNLDENSALDGTVDIGGSLQYIKSGPGTTMQIISMSPVSAMPLNAGLNILCTQFNLSGPHSITVADTATETFTIAGDETEFFSYGSRFVVSGSTGNDGTWITSSVSFTGGNTEVIVTGDITDATADGVIDTLPRYLVVTEEPSHTDAFDFARVWKNGFDHLHFVNPDGHQFKDFPWLVQELMIDVLGIFVSSGIVTTESVLEDLALAISSGTARRGVNKHPFPAFESGNTEAITAVNQGTKTFTVAGDQTGFFSHGSLISIDGSTGNDGTYHVQAAAFGGVNTEIEIEEAIPDATADGHLHVQAMTFWHYDFATLAWKQEHQNGDEGSALIDVVYYNDATGTPAFVELGVAKYGVAYVFVLPDGQSHVIYGQGNYSLSEALAVGLPSSLPEMIEDFGVYVAKLTFVKNGTGFIDIFYPPVLAGGGGSAATSHESLSELFGGAGGDHWHVTENQHVALTNSLVVVDDADGKTVALSELGTTQTNSGATGGGVWNLPEASTWIGKTITGAVVAAQNMDWNPDDADLILGFTDSAGDALRSNTPGDSVVFRALDATNILARPVGTWVDVN